MNKRKQISTLFEGNKYARSLDFVTGWFLKASRLINKNEKVEVAFVTTNSITQGEQVAPLWNTLFELGTSILFATHDIQVVE